MSNQIPVNNGWVVAGIVTLFAGVAVCYIVKLRDKNHMLSARNAKMHRIMAAEYAEKSEMRRALAAKYAELRNRKGWFNKVQIGAAVATILNFFGD